MNGVNIREQKIEDAHDMMALSKQLASETYYLMREVHLRPDII